LYSENLLYYFSSQANLNRIIIDREEAIKEEDIKEEIYKVLEKISGKEFDVYLWPKASSDIPDNPKLKLIILSEDYPYKAAQTNEFINGLLTKYSSGFRTYKNTLIFLCVDESEFGSIKKLFIRLLALRSIKEDRTIVRSLSEENKHTLEDKLRKTDSMIPLRLFSAYRHLSKGSSEGIRFLDLGIPTIGDVLDISKRVKEFLKEQELLLDKISPSYLLNKTFAEQEQSKSFNEIKESFLKFLDLPMIEDESVLKSAIAKGVSEGILGVKIGDTVSFKEPVFEGIITEDVVVLMEEIAKQEKTKQSGKPFEGGTKVEEEKDKGEKIKTDVTKKIRIKAKIPWDKLSDTISGVIRPLKNEGAEIQLELEINAESIKGIKKDTLQLKIKETLNQIKAEIIEWEEI
ncbi:MAG: ATP-binding protein, partial [Candidatus Omnitrophica bacterium]|nr:ATP-binding protein [Candidatus Omnitrophota bacterium]